MTERKNYFGFCEGCEHKEKNTHTRKRLRGLICEMECPKYNKYKGDKDIIHRTIKECEIDRLTNEIKVLKEIIDSSNKKLITKEKQLNAINKITFN